MRAPLVVSSSVNDTLVVYSSSSSVVASTTIRHHKTRHSLCKKDRKVDGGLDCCVIIIILCFLYVLSIFSQASVCVVDCWVCSIYLFIFCARILYTSFISHHHTGDFNPSLLNALHKQSTSSAATSATTSAVFNYDEHGSYSATKQRTRGFKYKPTRTAAGTP